MEKKTKLLHLRKTIPHCLNPFKIVCCHPHDYIKNIKILIEPQTYLRSTYKHNLIY